jgi:hypothetical protein
MRCLLLSTVLIVATTTLTRAEDLPGFAVVELFTSQGCSSCPPADEVLIEMNKAARNDRQPVYVLSLHVDYWNDLGWADPYSAKHFSQRQRSYAAARKSSRVYTPQMIVNGSEEFVGSRGEEAKEAVKSALARHAKAVVILSLKPTEEKGTWQVVYEVEHAGPEDQLVVCLAADVEANEVPRGENTGQSLKHHGVVLAMKAVAIEDAADGSTEIRLPDDKRSSVKEARVIAFVQNLKTMAITGAAAIPLEIDKSEQVKVGNSR